MQEAQRQRDIAEREAQMAALFRQEFIPKDLRKSSKASGAAAAAGDTSTGGGATARAESPPPPAERVKTCKEELERVKSATGASGAAAAAAACVCAGRCCSPCLAWDPKSLMSGH